MKLRYTAKLPFRQSLTLHSDYTVTVQSLLLTAGSKEIKYLGLNVYTSITWWGYYRWQIYQNKQTNKQNKTKQTTTKQSRDSILYKVKEGFQMSLLEFGIVTSAMKHTTFIILLFLGPSRHLTNFDCNQKHALNCTAFWTFSYTPKKCTTKRHYGRYRSKKLNCVSLKVYETVIKVNFLVVF